MLPSLQFVKDESGMQIRMTKMHLYLSAFSFVASLGLLTWWWAFSWGDHLHDIQMKWIAFGAGVTFFVLGVSALLRQQRFLTTGQRFRVSKDKTTVTIESQQTKLQIPVRDIAGLQLLRRMGDVQLNIVYQTDGRWHRAWVHTDLAGNIGPLIMSFGRLLGLEIVSDFTIKQARR